MNWKKRFVSQKLNVKFTLVIILFMVIPIGILAGILFYNMEKNVVSENTGYMEYTMERNKDAVATKINSINMSTQFFLSDEPLLEERRTGRLFRRRNGTALRTAILCPSSVW